VTPSEDRRDSWSLHQDPSGGPPPGNFGKPPSSRSPVLDTLRRIVRTLFILAAIGAAGYYGWKYGVPLWSHVRANSDLESAAGYFAHELPKEVGTEDDLRRTVAVVEADKLKGHLALKGRWFVAFGPRGDDLKVLRDDSFDAEERLFATKFLDECRLLPAQPGTALSKLEYPMGVRCQGVLVEGRPWWVVAAWSESEQ
jgi:hypothetical protein